MSTQKASSEAHALEIALANFRKAHPATEPVCSSVSATRSTSARGVESQAQYAVQIDYMSQRFSRLQGCLVPEQRSACYYIDASDPRTRINTGTELSNERLVIIPRGGIGFNVSLDGEFLGSMEFGSIDDGGQYEQDDEEIIDEARERFEIEESIPAVVR